jgi:hypothetical protein
MEIIFEEKAAKNDEVMKLVEELLDTIPTLEKKHKMHMVIFQDGVNGAFYIKCSILAEIVATLFDLNAKLDLKNPESFRANRELLLRNRTYLKMENDAANGREFNDIIVEYTKEYDKDTPLKVWGGQHRINAIKQTGTDKNHYHGFRIYFDLSAKQRTEVALISNTNINVSNDTFDRMVEETTFGDRLRRWCQLVNLLNKEEDFPDVGARSEKITVKRARSFLVNYYLGKVKGQELKDNDLDQNVYEPYLSETGVSIDPKYSELMNKKNILKDTGLIEAGKRFAVLHNAQYRAVTDPNNSIENRKSFRIKAFIESVLCGWSYVAGLLQSHPERLANHYRIPKTNKKIPDPLNAKEMSEFKHDSDKPTYRGLGTRSSSRDRQRIAQLFLAKSKQENVYLDKSFMNKSVSQVMGILYSSKGYT